MISKDHYKNSLEVPEELFMKMMRTVKKIAHTFEGALGYKDFNIGMNNGAASGQTVFHAHIHVMPRREGDGYKLWHGLPTKKDRPTRSQAK